MAGKMDQYWKDKAQRESDNIKKVDEERRAL
jgi:hypothetical protein